MMRISEYHGSMCLSPTCVCVTKVEDLHDKPGLTSRNRKIVDSYDLILLASWGSTWLTRNPGTSHPEAEE